MPGKQNKSNPNKTFTNLAKKFIAGNNLFGVWSIFPRGNSNFKNTPLNSQSISFLENGKGMRKDEPPPQMSEEKLTREGMSKQKAQIVLYIIKNFNEIEKLEKNWKKTGVKGEEMSDFCNCFYKIADWIFEKPNFANDDLVHDTVVKLTHLRLKHGPRFTDLDSTIEGLEDLVKKIPTLDTIKDYLKKPPQTEGNKAVLAVIEHLEEGAKSYNPTRRYNSQNKLDQILECVVSCKEKDHKIDDLLADESSNLSKAIAMRRLSTIHSDPSPTESQLTSSLVIVKDRFASHEKLMAIITRLEVGAKSNNPYWYRSEEKLNKICECLIENSYKIDQIDRALSTEDSPLSQAINMRRWPTFSSKPSNTESRDIVIGKKKDLADAKTEGSADEVSNPDENSNTL